MKRFVNKAYFILSAISSYEENIWSKITWIWAAFFSLCAGFNICITFQLHFNVWVSFKVFGLLAATFGFTLLTGIYIYKYIPKDDNKANKPDAYFGAFRSVISGKERSQSPKYAHVTW
ncbi:septation protein IspZ [Vibrio sp. Hep-1b-8]|nr:hypothetical protein DA100_00545 [Vibrio sp. Hep-1b-8]